MRPRLQHTQNILDLIENDTRKLKFGQTSQGHLNEYERPGPGRNDSSPCRQGPSELTGYLLLVPIGDKHSILDIVLCQLAQQGFSEVTLAIGYLGNLIRAYVGDGNRWGIEIGYASEDVPLGTIGPVLRILDHLPEDLASGCLIRCWVKLGRPWWLAGWLMPR